MPETEAERERRVREDSIANIKVAALTVEQTADKAVKAGVADAVLDYYDDLAADLRLIANGLETGRLVDTRSMEEFTISGDIIADFEPAVINADQIAEAIRDTMNWEAKTVGLADHQGEKAPKPLTLYVGGPMTGYPLWNFPAFHEGARLLREAGFNAIDPAELDIKAGFAAETKKEDLSPSMLREFMARDLHLILMESDGVALLPGWESSKGAAAEIAAAEAVGLPVKTVEQWLAEAKSGAKA